MPQHDDRANIQSFEDWKIKIHNTTNNVTNAWTCIKGFPFTFVVLGVIVFLSCCCTLYLRNRIVNVWKILTCKKKRKKNTGTRYDKDVEQGKFFWQKPKKPNSPKYVKIEQQEQKRNVADLGIQNNVSATGLSIDSSTTGCYKCYKKKKRNKRSKR